MSLVLPLPDSFDPASTSQIKPVLIYQFAKSGEGAADYIAMTTPSELRIEGRFALVKVSYFGTYQIAIPSIEILTRIEKKAEDSVAPEMPTPIVDNQPRVYWQPGVQTLSTTTSTPLIATSHGTGWVLPVNHAVVATTSGVPIISGFRAQNFDAIP
jgi:hypothetical protein